MDSSLFVWWAKSNRYKAWQLTSTNHRQYHQQKWPSIFEIYWQLVHVYQNGSSSCFISMVENFEVQNIEVLTMSPHQARIILSMEHLCRVCLLHFSGMNPIDKRALKSHAKLTNDRRRNKAICLVKSDSVLGKNLDSNRCTEYAYNCFLFCSASVFWLKIWENTLHFRRNLWIISFKKSYEMLANF